MRAKRKMITHAGPADGFAPGSAAAGRGLPPRRSDALSRPRRPPPGLRAADGGCARLTGRRPLTTRGVAILALVLAAWAGPGGGAGAAEADAAGDARALEARRQELKSRVEAVQRELAAAETSRADAADALQTSARAISDANRRLHDLAAERRRIAAALAALDAERSALAVQVRSEQTLLARLLARQQRGSEHDWLKLLLSGRDPGDISRLLHYYRAISEARARSIAGLRANQQRAQALADEALARQQRLDALAQDEQAQRSLLEQGRRQQAQVQARVAADIRRQQRELDRLQRDDARLARLLDRLAELARSRPPPPDRPPEAATVPAAGNGLRRGSTPMPVRGELTARFGAPRDGGKTAWKGWFIRCTTGEEVRSIAAGQVVYADWLRGFGNLLIVDHGDGYMSLYGNNDALLAEVGATVREGEAIAQAGASGGSAVPGVYFEIRHQGAAVDPATWIGR